MTAALRDRQLQRFCDVLSSANADAPTLCEGWTAHDLAIHVWILKRDPWGWPGVVAGSLGGRRAEKVRRRWTYAALVTRLRQEPGAIACMPFDRWEGHRHALGEYWMHTQDVARPQEVTQPTPDEALQDALWLRVQKVARHLHRGTSGLVLARPDGRRAAVTSGPVRLLVTGEPTELMCWAHGRTAYADVALRRQ